MSTGMQLADRIELRRFVGREFLLWLWFESELFEATLATKKHGMFGLWLEGALTLSEGKEVTIIKGSTPGFHREAKESLLRGKLPERAGIHLTWGDNESTVTLKGEAMAFAGLKLPTKIDKAEDDEDDAVKGLMPAPPPRKKRAGPPGADASDVEHEEFYERMHLAREVEDIFETLYKDFLGLRLGSAWEETVLPAIKEWTQGDEVDSDEYMNAKIRALAGPKRR